MKKLLIIAILFFVACSALKPTVLSDYEASRASQKAADIYEQGNAYFKQKEYKKAISELSEIIEKYDQTDAYEPALYITAFSFYKLNKYEDAAKYGEKFVKKFPSSTFILNATSLVGESYYKLADDYKAAYYLIKFYTKTDDDKARKKAGERIIKVLPELTIKQLEKLHRVFMSDPIDEHILFTLAQIEAREGKKEEAERDFNLLTRRFPDTKYTAEVREYQRFINLGETTGSAGVILPLTGKWANIGQKLVEIIEFFQKEKSLPFMIHYLDTKSDPIDATLAAKKLIDDFNTDFLICLTSIYNSLGICGLAAGKGIPVILPMTAEARLEKIPLVYTTGHRRDEQARLVARYSMAHLGMKRFAILYPDQAKYASIAQAFANEVIQHNHEVVAMVKFDPDSITLKWEITSIKKKNPEAIFLPMDRDIIINTAPQIAYYGLERVQLLGIDTFKDEKVPRLGEKYVENAVFTSPAPIDSATLYEFKQFGYDDDDLSVRLFYTLWKLRNLGPYTRTALPDMISEILKDREYSYIYQIRNGDFVKLAEIAE